MKELHFSCFLIFVTPFLWQLSAVQNPTFDVVSVKRNVGNGAMDVRPRRSGDLVMMHDTDGPVPA